MLYFNSIKVRLERSSESAFVFIASFQFHKGAIRTITQLILGISYSHFNSIKVRLERIFTTIEPTQRSHFNSIKVRLEPNDFICPTCKRPHFNSIKVRLERKGSGRVFQPITSFQFHKGAIRTAGYHRINTCIYISIP